MLRALSLLAAVLLAPCAAAEVVIGSKVFTEGVILGEIGTQLVRDYVETAKNRRE
jgi:glycine betaine/choline ABC-type transport system substrate-binding protein